MRVSIPMISTVLAAALVTACGGGGGDSLTPVNTGGVTKVVTFGDSLSDVGSYAFAAIEKGGGRFTVNGAGPRIWTEFLAQSYGITLTPNEYITDAGAQINPAGTAYAEGGARVNPRSTSPIKPILDASLPPDNQVFGFLTNPTAGTATAACTATGLFQSRYGLNPNSPVTGIDANNPSNLAGCIVGTDLALSDAQRAALNDNAGIGFFVSDDSGVSAALTFSGAPAPSTAVFARTGLTTRPTEKQVASFLTSNPTGNSNTLITMLAGANDLFFVAGAVSSGLPLQNGQLLSGAIAVEVAKQVKSLQQAGYSKILVGNLPDIGKTPLPILQTFPGNPAAAQGLYTALSVAYNTALDACLSNTSCPGVVDANFSFDSNKVLAFDTKSLFDDVAADITRGAADKKYGIAALGPACNVGKANSVNGGTFYGFSSSQSLPLKTTNSSLFCNSGDLVSAGADSLAIFADAVHPTPVVHNIFANAVLAALRTKGWR